METAERLPLRPEGGLTHNSNTPADNPSPVSLSCVQCRSRKLRCDRRRPTCERCSRQNEKCSYPGLRQRALGRRKTVRELEERIEELEGLLRNSSLGSAQATELELSNPSSRASAGPPLFQDPNLDVFGMDPFAIEEGVPYGQTQTTIPSVQSADQLISLGLFEQLPPFDVMDELVSLYFRNIHSGAPMLHQASYIAGLRLPPHMRPPMCLQYIVLASAAATSEIYRHLSEPFYQRARAYAEADELKGQGEVSITLAHVQAWCLISAYECHVYAIFTRASTSHCRGVRIAQMLKLHQLDVKYPGPELVHSGLPPPRSWMEAEERRRTWWVVFLADRYLSSTTGWPSLVDERHVRTNLPSTEESFAAGRADDPPISLSKGLQQLEQGRGAQVSPLAIRILAANELLHALDNNPQHFSETEDSDKVLNGLYWARHGQIDTNLTTLTMLLPERLHLLRTPRTLDAILVHTSTNMATIHLHRTALALLYERPPRAPEDPDHQLLIAQSQARLLPAAEGILAVFRAAGDGVGTAIRNPLLSFAAYLAASVFLEDYFREVAGEEGRPRERGPGQSEEKLRYLARTLVFFGGKSPLVRAVAYQLAADMKRTGYDSSLMDRMVEQVDTLGGSKSEIRVRGEMGGVAPVVFCPALATPGPSQIPVYGGFMSVPAAGGYSMAPFMSLHTGSPDGLFSHLALDSNNLLFPGGS